MHFDMIWSSIYHKASALVFLTLKRPRFKKNDTFIWLSWENKTLTMAKCQEVWRSAWGTLVSQRKRCHGILWLCCTEALKQGEFYTAEPKRIKISFQVNNMMWKSRLQKTSPTWVLQKLTSFSDHLSQDNELVIKGGVSILLCKSERQPTRLANGVEERNSL